MTRTSKYRDSRERNDSSKVFSIRIKLRNYTPSIWRRIEVPYDFTLHQLHLTIQAAMGWENYHLYAFRNGSMSYSVPSTEWPNEDLDSRKTRINELVFFGTKCCVEQLFKQDVASAP